MFYHLHVFCYFVYLLLNQTKASVNSLQVKQFKQIKQILYHHVYLSFNSSVSILKVQFVEFSSIRNRLKIIFMFSLKFNQLCSCYFRMRLSIRSSQMSLNLQTGPLKSSLNIKCIINIIIIIVVVVSKCTVIRLQAAYQHAVT